MTFYTSASFKVVSRLDTHTLRAIPSATSQFIGTAANNVVLQYTIMQYLKTAKQLIWHMLFFLLFSSPFIDLYNQSDSLGHISPSQDTSIHEVWTYGLHC
jgi:hypothetical protein